MVFFNLLLSYLSHITNVDKDCTPPVQMEIIATVTVNFTKFQSIVFIRKMNNYG